MNRTRLLMIGIVALAFGVVVATYVYKNLQARAGGANVDTTEAYVAANDLQVGAKITDRDIAKIRIPVADLPVGAPRKRADVLEHGVILPITKGDFILKTKLAGDNAGSGLPALIPTGMRAVSVRVNEVVSVAGFVTAGTRVDVLLTGTPATSGEQQTTTVLQNVLVLASGHTLERSSTGEAQNTAVITLEVSPEDAQKLALASSQGHIQLALRSPLDTKQEDVASTGSRGLFKGFASPSPQPVVHRAAPRTVVAPPPPTSTGVSVEVYQGDKKQEVKFPDESPEAK